MTAFTPAPATLEENSREFALVVDVNGVIGWADERTARFVGASVAELAGRPFAALVAPGSGEKMARMIAAAHTPGKVQQWELLLHAADGPTMATVTAVPFGTGILMTGTASNAGSSALLAQMGEAMSEIAALHRESERQQREIEEGRAELTRLNRDLVDSGHGLAALYGELSDRRRRPAPSRRRRAPPRASRAVRGSRDSSPPR